MDSSEDKSKVLLLKEEAVETLVKTKTSSPSKTYKQQQRTVAKLVIEQCLHSVTEPTLLAEMILTSLEANDIHVISGNCWNDFLSEQKISLKQSLDENFEKFCITNYTV